jgi:mono/diheme cytochrome c family protein
VYDPTSATGYIRDQRGTMKKVLVVAALVWTGAAVLLAQSGTPAGASQQVAASGNEAAKHRAWLNQYCVACHNSRTASPASEPVNLETASLDDVLAHAETWERVLRKLSVRAMPPQGMPRPGEADYVAFTTWLSGSLDRAAAARNNPGRYVVHRLNRTEYGNAIRDLLALDINVTDLLPSDGGDFGFDNIAAALRTSPFLLERYLTAAQRISALAVGDPDVRPGTADYPISRELTQSGHLEGLPLGTRGGTLVRHVFPADGEYELAGRLIRGVEEGYAGIEGHELPHTFIITIDGAEVYSAPVGGLADHNVQAKDVNHSRLVIDARMTARVPVTAGPHEVGFTWAEKPRQEQDVWQPSLRDSLEIHMVGGLPRLRAVSIAGPYNVTGVSSTPSRARIFVCRPVSAADEPVCARRILSTLSRRAFRRPVTAEDVEAPLAFYTQARQEGASFDAGIRSGLARILASPWFLYRVERDPAGVRPGAPHRISDIELASRLSFFLWSSIPDEQLLRLATAGTLRQPTVLAAQVRRMVADERADAMVSNFTGQWLQLRNLESRVTPDLLLFPDFDDNIRKAFRRETELFFAHVVRQNRSALELLNADYTFVNERLARHYGIPGVYGSRFRQVKLTDPNRRGLLGHGSVLSLTSVATRTSPVLRGKFVLSTFLNTPPPPPPPNVPTLEESSKGAAAKPKTVREQMELHRSNPTCASCHRLIDPVGFALENFNPVGQWRQATPEGTAIDAAGVLSDGSKVDGPAALREVILSRPEAFVTILTERMLTYALGRGVEPSDMSVVRSIVRQAAQNNYRFTSIIMGIVESAPFQMRTALEPAEPANRVAQATP